MRLKWIFPGLLLLLAGCAGATTAVPPTPTPEVVVADTAVPPTTEEVTAVPVPTHLPDDTAVPPPVSPSPQPPTPSPPHSPIPTTPGQNRRIADDTVYNFPQLLPFDGIRPVYNPEFAPADEAPLSDDELVMGVAWGGEAKAYPVTVMRSREMVNDELAGIPTLVTW